MDLSVIVPVYHGEETVGALTDQLKAALDGKIDWELIFIYDCGPDRSWEELCRLVDQNHGLVTAIALQKNCGQHAATSCAISYSRGDWVLTMDEDLQHSPGDIVKLLETRDATGADVIYGNYDTGKKHDFVRSFPALMVKVLIGIAVPGVPHYVSAFRLIKGDCARKLNNLKNSGIFLDGALSSYAQKYQCCKVEHQQRLAGESGYSWSKLIRYALMIFVNYSIYPYLLTGIGIVLLAGAYVGRNWWALPGCLTLALGLGALWVRYRTQRCTNDANCPVREVRR